MTFSKMYSYSSLCVNEKNNWSFQKRDIVDDKKLRYAIVTCCPTLFSAPQWFTCVLQCHEVFPFVQSICWMFEDIRHLIVVVRLSLHLRHTSLLFFNPLSDWCLIAVGGYFSAFNIIMFKEFCEITSLGLTSQKRLHYVWCIASVYSEKIKTKQNKITVYII